MQSIKIAIPTRNKLVDDHFGHCAYYTFFSISEKKEIEDEEMYEAPAGCGCKSNIAGILRENGVEVLLAGNMGQGAVNVISSAGITVYRGCSGDVKTLTEAFLKEEVEDSGKTCNHHHEDGHQCNH